MNIKLLINTDLKLLVIFQVLMEEKQVTKAAERLFVSQPAMSKSLARLRQLFDDPLFTRSSNQLIPTPKAELLHHQIEGLLSNIESLFEEHRFNPSTVKKCFRICAPEGLTSFFRRLLAEVRQAAPCIKIEHVFITDDFHDKLRNGEIDFALHHVIESEEGFDYDKLAAGTQVCVIPQGHPLQGKKKLDLEDYLRFDHVRQSVPQLTHSNRAIVDALLTRQGKKRNIIYETPYLAEALEVLDGSDCLLTVGDLNLPTFKDRLRFSTAKLPEELSALEISLYLIEHSRTLQSREHMWMRSQMLSVFDHISNQWAESIG